MALFEFLNTVIILIGLGGFFFSYTVLNRSVREILVPEDRLRLWNNVLGRFFNWIWLMAYLVIAGNLYLLYRFGGSATAGTVSDLQLRFWLGLILWLLFLYLYFSLFVRFNLAVGLEKWPDAESILSKIHATLWVGSLIGLAVLVITT